MTRQVGDTLIYESKKHQLLGEEELPKNDVRILELSDTEYKSLKNDATNSTACFRGFISSWEIKDNSLYLVSIIGKYKLSTDTPILADWYADILIIPTGIKLHHDLVTPLADIYEYEIHLNIEKGIVSSSETIDRREEYESIYGSVKNMSRDQAIAKLRKFVE